MPPPQAYYGKIMAENQHALDLSYAAKGFAVDAVQAIHSHEALDTLRFENMDKKQDEIRELIAEVVKEMRVGFKSYDSKFWTLAIMVIASLLTGIVTLLIHGAR